MIRKTERLRRDYGIGVQELLDAEEKVDDERGALILPMMCVAFVSLAGDGLLSLIGAPREALYAVGAVAAAGTLTFVTVVSRMCATQYLDTHDMLEEDRAVVKKAIAAKRPKAPSPV